MILEMNKQQSPPFNSSLFSHCIQSDTPQLLRWAKHNICILVEKPVAISEKQALALKNASGSFKANIWVAMEYRYIPAIQKLYQLLPHIGRIKVSCIVSLDEYLYSSVAESQI